MVDADPAVRSACAEIAASLGYAVESTADMSHARSLLRGRAADILLVNLPYGSSQGLELVSEVKLLYPQTAVIAMTASGTVNAAVEAMRCGASDYLTKPFAIDELSTVLERAAANLNTDMTTRQLRERLRLSEGLGAMIGRSGEMEKLYRILSKVAQSTHPVLILGESGTGKELVARTIHAYGPSAQKPFLPGGLRLAGSHADRERTFRLREGRVHGGQSVQGWPSGIGRRGNGLSGRDWRVDARPAG